MKLFSIYKDSTYGFCTSWIALCPTHGIIIKWPWFWGRVGLQFMWHKWRFRVFTVSQWREAHMTPTGFVGHQSTTTTL